MNNYEVNNTITIANITYTIIASEDVSHRPILVAEGFARMMWLTRKGSRRTYSASVLTNGQVTRPRGI